MKKKLTYAELDAERARLAKSEGMLSIALNLVLHRKPEATAQASHEGDCWKLQLYGAVRVDGGIVIETFYHPGQRPHSAAYYLEDLTRIPGRLSEAGLKYTAALGRLRAARDRIAYEVDRRPRAPTPSAPTPVQDAAGTRDAYFGGDKREVSTPGASPGICLSVIVDDDGRLRLEKLPELPDVAQAMSAYERLWKAALEHGYTLRGGTLEVGGREFRVSQNGRIWDGDRAVSVEEAEALNPRGAVTAQGMAAEKAAKRYSIRHENGAVIADDLTFDQVEQWWKSGDGSGQTNGDRYFGLRTDGHLVIVTDAREQTAETAQGAEQVEDEQGVTDAYDQGR